MGKYGEKKMERKMEKKMGINVNRKMAKEWIDDIREEKGMVGGENEKWRIIEKTKEKNMRR